MRMYEHVCVVCVCVHVRIYRSTCFFFKSIEFVTILLLLYIFIFYHLFWLRWVFTVVCGLL